MGIVFLYLFSKRGPMHDPVLNDQPVLYPNAVGALQSTPFKSASVPTVMCAFLLFRSYPIAFVKLSRRSCSPKTT
jgi:hypothetical protein